MNERIDAKDFSESEQYILDTIKHIRAISPMSTLFFTATADHHLPTAQHEMRVALTMIEASRELGLEGRFAGQCGIIHDSGKLGVKAEILDITNGVDERLHQMTGPHMRLGRLLFRLLPSDIMEVAMAHHEILSPKGYPRKKGRAIPNARIRAYQLLLAMSDKADKKAYTLMGERQADVDDVRMGLKRAVDKTAKYLSSAELRWIERPIDVVAKATISRRPAVAEEVMRIMREEK